MFSTTLNDYYYQNDSLIQFQNATIDDAQFICSMVFNGELVSILSAFESSFLLNQSQKYFGSESYFWTGGFQNLFKLNASQTNPWSWYDFNNFSYTNWAKNEPKIYPNLVGCDHYGDDDSTLGMVVSTTDGQWYRYLMRRYHICGCIFAAQL